MAWLLHTIPEEVTNTLQQRRVHFPLFSLLSAFCPFIKNNNNIQLNTILNTDTKTVNLFWREAI